MSKKLVLDPDEHIKLRLTTDPNDIAEYEGYVILPNIVNHESATTSRYWKINIKQELFALIASYSPRVIVYDHDTMEPHIMPWYFVLELQDISDDEFLMLKLAWP